MTHVAFPRILTAQMAPAGRHRKRWSRAQRIAVTTTLVLLMGGFGYILLETWMTGSSSPSTYIADDAILREGTRRGVIEIFPPRSGHPRAVIVFLGNDVGFWRPHRLLAAGLGLDGYAVVGLDIRDVFRELPDDPDARATAVTRRLRDLIQRGYDEFAKVAPDTTRATTQRPPPLLLMGHSLGAELALWTAANVRPAALAGVIALSPGSRSHLRVTAGDLLMSGEPMETGSFAVADVVHQLVTNDSDARVAVVRGSQDRLRSADSAILAAGRMNAKRIVVPLGTHSMTDVGLAGWSVRRALAWVLAATPAAPELGVVRSPAPAPVQR